MTREEAWKPVDTADSQEIDESLWEVILGELYPLPRYQFMNQGALERVSNANLTYSYYDLEGQYWSPPSIGYEPTVMPINLARWFVKKRAAWMFEVAPDIECPPESYDPPEMMESESYTPSKKQAKLNRQASTRESILYRIYNDNNLEEKLLEGTRDHLIGGTVAIRITHSPAHGIRILFKPTQEVFPVYDPDDPEFMTKVHFCSFLDNDKTIWKQTWELINGRCYLSEGTYDTNLRPLTTKYTRADTFLDFIPIILVPNEGLSGDPFGRSYLHDLIPMFDQYNRSMSDAADALRFNLFAVTVLLNAAPGAEENLKISPGEVWNVGGEGLDVKKLESSFNYADALKDFLTRLENVMHMIGEVPDITPDRIKGFGLVSGVALKLLYSDLVSATQQSWRVWKSRMTTMNEYIFRMLETYSGKPGFYYAKDKKMDVAAIAGDYTTRIIPHLPLPENEMENIEMEVRRMSSSLQSVKGALQNLGEKYPERKIAEMIGERLKFLGDGEGFGKMLDREEKKLMGGL